MVTVEEAVSAVLAHRIPLQIESIPFDQASGRVVAQDLAADRDFPPFDRVTMDGIAISYEDFNGKGTRLEVSGIAPAGAPRTKRQGDKTCVEVMTGAPLPLGTDTVIRYEDIAIADGIAEIQIDDIRHTQNVHDKGLDRTTGDVLVNAGQVLSAGELGIAATVGASTIDVYRKPRICVVSTGDELVPIEATPEPHQIRASNVHSVMASLETHGATCTVAHLLDNYEAIKAELKVLLENNDAVVLSGGVSKGKFDYVPEVLAELSVSKAFHGISQRPGKPFWFGYRGGSAPCAVFALPGNPVSTLACTARYIVPWLRQSLLQPIDNHYAILDAQVDFRPDLTFFKQIKLSSSPTGTVIASPVYSQGSGDLASLSGTHAFIELPRGKQVFEPGQVYKYWRW